MYRFRFEVVWEHLPYLLNGVWITALVTVAAITLGIVIGLAVAICRVSRKRFLSIPTTAYIEFFRNTPSLVQLIWVYYLVPIVLGLETGSLTSCIVALAVSAGAYMAEIFRAGIQDVGRGDVEAALSLGMTPAQTMRRIILPQAVRKMIPPFANTFIVFLKYSSLVSVLGVADLTYRAQVISSSTFRPLEVFTVLAFLYFFLCYGLSRCMGLVERRMAVDV